MTRLVTIGVALAFLAGCGGGGGGKSAGVCDNTDGALSKTAFVFVESPASGERVASPFSVSGCSSTFEATVNWRLKGRDGHALASGFTRGGSMEPGPFDFTVTYSVAERQLGQLEVYEPTVTTEGFPAVKNVLPIMLEP